MGSPNKPRGSIGSLEQDEALERICEAVTPVHISSSQVQGQCYQRRRRASMQDALDHTKINASLYEPVNKVDCRKGSSSRLLAEVAG